MLTFLQPVDIGNRAADHCGAARMDLTLGFADGSRTALIVGPLYDKLRRAELQRNTWQFAIKQAVLRSIDQTTMLLVASLWVSTTTYFVGSIVADEDGTLWISRVPNNLGNQPGQPTTIAQWAEYFGPLTVQPWDTTGATAYAAGEVVYTAAGDGTNRVYLSLISANSDNPATATAWSSTVTYFKNQIVTASSTAYMSRIDLNLNQNPATTFVAEWASGTTYATGNKVTGSDGTIYQSIGNGNLGHDPTATTGFWTNTGVLSPWDTTFVSGTGSLNWRQIGGAEFPMGVTLTKWNEVYPLDAGPSNQANTRNIYRLPAGFLAKAPQDPKAGSVSLLGAPSNDIYDDWLFQDDYIVSSQAAPIRLRFVADTVDVTKFDDMFCEGLGARLGVEACESLTQSTEKVRTIEGAYNKFMFEARLKNAILIGSEEPALDDWLACRY